MINRSHTVFTVIQNENKAIRIAALLKREKRLAFMLPYKIYIKSGETYIATGKNEYYIFYYNVK